MEGVCSSIGKEELRAEPCMQGAARLHEFIIKVAHPLEEHASKVYFHLHVVCVSFVSLNI